MEAAIAIEPYRPGRPPRRRQVTLRGLRYQLTEWGPTEGTPLILLHGWMDCGASWQFLVDALHRERRILAPDWRGFGDSDWCPNGYWFPDYLADLDALLDAEAADQAVDLVGHSMGGNVAGLYAGVRPERIRRLGLLEGFGMRPPAATEAPDRYRQWLEEQKDTPEMHTPASWDGLAERLMRQHPHMPPEHAAFVARCWARENPDGSLTLRGDPRHKQKNPVLYRLEEAQACWRNITAPSLWIWGTESRVLRMFEDKESWEARVRCFRDWRGVAIENAGHMLQHDQPQAVAEALEPFLA